MIIDLFADKVAQVLPKTPIRTVIVVTIADLLPWLTRTVVRAVQQSREEAGAADQLSRTSPSSDALASGQAARQPRAPIPMVYRRERRRSIASPRCSTPAAPPGVSKGAVLTEGNLLANVAQCIEVWKPGVLEGRETVVTALPLYHIFAFTANLMVFFAFGGRNILIPSPRPLANLTQALTGEGATWLTGVNTLFAGLMHETWFQQHPALHAEGHGGRRHGAGAGGGRALGDDDQDADVPGLRPHRDLAGRVARAVPSQQARVDRRAGARAPTCASSTPTGATWPPASRASCWSRGRR